MLSNIYLKPKNFLIYTFIESKFNMNCNKHANQQGRERWLPYQPYKNFQETICLTTEQAFLYIHRTHLRSLPSTSPLPDFAVEIE